MSTKANNLSQCPDDQMMDLFLQGDLGEKESLALFNHLATCASCEYRITNTDRKWTRAEKLNTLLQGESQSFRFTFPPPPPDPDQSSGNSGRDLTDTSSLKIPVIAGMSEMTLVGKGGMGVVYRAWEEDLKRPVAIKVIGLEKQISDEWRARAVDEAIAMARIIHDNVVHIHGWGEWQGHPWFAMDWIAGGTLEDWQKGKKVTPRQAAEIVRNLARGVEAVHEAGIIHCDLKPANILLHPVSSSSSFPFTPKIADFGVASLFSGSAIGSSDPDTVIGSPAYMAPEQTSLNPLFDPVSPRTDIHGLGTILYSLLTAQPPYQGLSSWETLNKAARGDYPPLSLLVPNLPKDLIAITQKALSHSPSDRYPSAAGLAEDLGRYLEGLPVIARPIPFPNRLWKWFKRKPLLAATSLLALLLLSSLMIQQTIHLWKESRTSQIITQKKAEAKKLKELLMVQEDSIRQLVRQSRPLDEEIKKTILKIRDQYLLWSTDDNSPEAHLERAIGILNVGDLFQKINQLEEASKCQQMALKEIESVPDQEESSLGRECRYKRFHGIIQLENNYRARGQLSESENLMRKEIAYYQRNPQTNFEDRVNLAICEEYLALDLILQQKHREADQWFNKGIEDLLFLRTMNPDDRKIWDNLVFFLYNFGLYSPRNLPSTTYLEYFGTLLCIAQEGASRFSDNPKDFILYQLRALSGLYDWTLNNNQPELAKAYIDDKFAILETEIKKSPGDIYYEESFIESANQEFGVLLILKRPLEAEEKLRQAVLFAEMHFQKEPAIYNRSKTLMNTLMAFGYLLRIRDMPTEALARFEQLESTARLWLKSEANRNEIHYVLSNALGHQSDLLSQLGKYPEAVAKQEEKLKYDTPDHRSANLLDLARKRLNANNKPGAREAALEAGKDENKKEEVEEFLKSLD